LELALDGEKSSFRGLIYSGERLRPVIILQMKRLKRPAFQSRELEIDFIDFSRFNPM